MLKMNSLAIVLIASFLYYVLFPTLYPTIILIVACIAFTISYITDYKMCQALNESDKAELNNKIKELSEKTVQIEHNLNMIKLNAAMKK